jgi:hypothetical protein
MLGRNRPLPALTGGFFFTQKKRPQRHRSTGAVCRGILEMGTGRLTIPTSAVPASVPIASRFRLDRLSSRHLRPSQVPRVFDWTSIFRTPSVCGRGFSLVACLKWRVAYFGQYPARPITGRYRGRNLKRYKNGNEIQNGSQPMSIELPSTSRVDAR